MQLRVTNYGEPVLKQPGERVMEFGPELRQFARDMLETMHVNDGIGLAAQQVGRPIQMFVADMRVSVKELDFSWTLDGAKTPLDLFMPLVAVNPEIETSGEPEPYEEGCLSFPGIRGDVERPRKAAMVYQNLDGETHRIEADGLFARVIQHEFDHLQGILFTERMSKLTLFGLGTKLKRLRRETREFLKANG